MKTMSCDKCEASFQAETFGEWMEQMKTHYAEMHKDVMEDKGNLSDEEKQQQMQQWMTEAQERFNALPDAE